MTVDLKKKWWAWHKENPEFYELFKKFTFQAIQKGHRNPVSYTHLTLPTNREV